MSWKEVQHELEKIEKIVGSLETEEEKMEEGKQIIGIGESPQNLEEGARPKNTPISQVEIVEEKQELEVGTSSGAAKMMPSTARSSTGRKKAFKVPSPLIIGLGNTSGGAFSEPDYVIRGPGDIGSPPSYRRFSSPRPPRLVMERKLSAGILRTSGDTANPTTTGLNNPETARSSRRAEPSSPAPSVDRLSVTFAVDDFDQPQTEGDKDVEPLKAETTQELIEPAFAKEEEQLEEIIELIGESGDEYTDSLLEIRKSRSRGSSIIPLGSSSQGMRKSSITTLGGRRKSSLGSSVILGSRRRRGHSSSSGDSLLTSRSRSRSSAVSKGDGDTAKLHNEVIEQAKYQMWPLDKKLRLVQQAKEYVRKHQCEMEERLAQSRTFSSRLQQAYMYFIKYMQMAFKYLKDFLFDLAPWQQKIKDIESHFGSVVSSYFIFLRWIFWMNFAITLVLTFFVMIPEVLAADWEGTGARKKMLPVEEHYAYNLKVMWDFEGILRYSPIFYGYYSDKVKTRAGYRIPLAYFCSGMAVYIFSFAIILKKMAQNSKQSKLSEKGDECTFTWKVFTSWDYGIANVETAHNKVASITMGFREALVEEQEKEKENVKSWKVIAKRISANFMVLILLGLSAYAVIFVVERSTRPDADSSWYRQNEITIVMSLISMVVPNFFDVISLLEDYHPRKAMRWMLARIMVLNLLSLYTLIIALFGKTDGMINSLLKMEEMKNAGINFGLETATEVYDQPKDCYQIPIPCELLQNPQFPMTIGSLQFNQPLYDIDSTLKATAKNVANNNDSYAMGKNEEWEKGLVALTDSKGGNCSECLDQCGANCSSVCNLLQTSCSETEKAPNITDMITEDVKECIRCVKNYTELIENPDEVKVDGQDLFEGQMTSESPESIDFVPVENNERHCTRQICRRRFFGTKKPPEVKSAPETCQDAKSRYIHELKEKLKLRKLCWETMFGQELVKLTVMDTVFTLMSLLIGDFGRSLFLRVMNPCWFWDLEKNFPKYPDFKVAENILHLVNNQGMIWMGLFMAPGLPLINLVKLAVIMYARSWAVMTTNVPHETVFRASRSNNFYFVLLLMMLFLCTLPVAYAIVWLKPSWHCGPFAPYDRMYKVFTEKIMDILPVRLHGTLDYITSPGIVIPTFVLLVLIIYYLISLTGLLRESNEDLKNQLHHERTEERRKLVKGKTESGSSGNVNEKWKRLLGSALSSQQDSKETRFEKADVEEEDTFSERAVDVPLEMRRERNGKAGIKVKEKKKTFDLVELEPLEELKKIKEHQLKLMRVSFQSINEISSVGEPATPEEKGSLCNRFILDAVGITEFPPSQRAKLVPEPKSTLDNIEDADELMSNKKPPKIWISKSASMDDDLNE